MLGESRENMEYMEDKGDERIWGSYPGQYGALGGCFTPQQPTVGVGMRKTKNHNLPKTRPSTEQ